MRYGKTRTSIHTILPGCLHLIVPQTASLVVFLRDFGLCWTHIVRCGPLPDKGAATNRLPDKTLLLTTHLNSLESVPDDSYGLLKRWYDEESGGDNWLCGVEAAVFRDESCRNDLLSLNGRAGKDDAIAVFIADRVLPVYDRLIGHRIHRPMSSKSFADVREYEMTTLVRLASAICMVLSATLPAAAILILCNLRSMVARLIAIVLMSLACSVIFGLVASRKADCFLFAVAFSAVLVVFVGNANGMD
jgi:hypothetical protein